MTHRAPRRPRKTPPPIPPQVQMGSGASLFLSTLVLYLLPFGALVWWQESLEVFEAWASLAGIGTALVTFGASDASADESLATSFGIFPFLASTVLALGALLESCSA